MIFYQELYRQTGGCAPAVTSKGATGRRGRRLGKDA
jgi:hypothetical protein